MKKKAVKHDQLCPFGCHMVYIFWGQFDLELLLLSYCLIAKCVTNIENKTNLTPLSVFRLSDARTRARRTGAHAKMEMLAWICDIYI